MIFDRTFHPDEANQAFTVGRLLETGVYTYRPTDHHGPTLYYAAAPIQKAFGHCNTNALDGTLLRCTPLLFGVLALVFGFFALKRLLGGWRGIAAGLVFAILLGTAPMFVFYATDFIQETLLAAFTLMMLWALVGYFTPHGRLKPGSWALLFGIAAGLAFATKETSVISFAAAGFTFIIYRAFHIYIGRMRVAHTLARPSGSALPNVPSEAELLRCIGGSAPTSGGSAVLEVRAPIGQATIQQPTTGNFIAFSLIAFLLTAATLFSSFGANWHGVYDAFISAPLSYLGRAAGDSAASTGAAWHVHPWWKYLEWLFLGKAIVTRGPGTIHLGGPLPFGLNMLSLLFMLFLPLGIFAAVKKHYRERVSPALMRAFFLSFIYTALVFIFYSAIPYKTPWCAVQLLVPFTLTATFGCALAAEVLAILALKRNPASVRSAWIASIIACFVVLPLTSVCTENIPGLQKICRDPDSPKIPFNYAHASPEVKDLAKTVADRMKQFAATSEKGCDPRSRGTRDPTRGGSADLEVRAPYNQPTNQLTNKPTNAGTTNNQQPSTSNFIAVALPACDTWPFPWYNRDYESVTGYWESFEELKQLAESGAKPAVVIVPMTQGHLVQPLFPHLKNTKRFYMRPGVRVRVFW